MCKLLSKITEQTFFTGYKVVKKNEAGNYVSPATGVVYPDLTLPENAFKMEFHFSNYFAPICELLKHHYDRYMVGRTGVFKFHSDACRFYKDFSRLDKDGILVKATVSQELMQGTFHSWPIVAGRNIEIKEECDEFI